jgi:hypothetical protein
MCLSMILFDCGSYVLPDYDCAYVLLDNHCAIKETEGCVWYVGGDEEDTLAIKYYQTKVCDSKVLR